MKTRNTLLPHVRKEAIAILNRKVADLFDLFARIKQACWNVCGTTWIFYLRDLDPQLWPLEAHLKKHR